MAKTTLGESDTCFWLEEISDDLHSTSILRITAEGLCIGAAGEYVSRDAAEDIIRHHLSGEDLEFALKQLGTTH